MREKEIYILYHYYFDLRASKPIIASNMCFSHSLIYMFMYIYTSTNRNICAHTDVWTSVYVLMMYFVLQIEILHFSPSFSHLAISANDNSYNLNSFLLIAIYFIGCRSCNLFCHFPTDSFHFVTLFSTMNIFVNTMNLMHFISIGQIPKNGIARTKDICSLKNFNTGCQTVLQIGWKISHLCQLSITILFYLDPSPAIVAIGHLTFFPAWKDVSPHLWQEKKS